MDTRELSKTKKELESELARLILEELRLFTDFTNTEIAAVTVSPVYVGYLGTEKKDLVSVSVKVMIDI